MKKLTLDRKHPVFSKPAGYGSYSNLCAWGKVAIAVGDSPSFFVHTLCKFVTIDQFWEVVRLNDRQKKHKEAIELAIKYLKQSGKVKVV